MSQNESKQAIVITRKLDIPVEWVWKAWTDPELLMKWWGPADYISPTCSIDLREGGKYLFCMRAPASQGGQDYYSTGVYESIVPLERLEFTHYLSDRDGNVVDPAEVGMPPDFPKKVHYTIEFKALDGQTELTITERGWTIFGQMSEFAVIGMQQSLDKLVWAFAN